MPMPQEDLWTSRANPGSVLSGLEPMDAQEACVACGPPDWSVLGTVHGLHRHKRSCGLAGFDPLSIPNGLEPPDAHEGSMACGSP